MQRAELVEEVEELDALVAQLSAAQAERASLAAPARELDALVVQLAADAQAESEASEAEQGGGRQTTAEQLLVRDARLSVTVTFTASCTGS
jgi:hypothetical protein